MGKASVNYAGALHLTGEVIRLNGIVAGFPRSWQSRLNDQLGRPRTWPALEEWRRQVDRLTAAEKGGIKPDATDADICNQADITARDFLRRLTLVEGIAKAKRPHRAHDGRFLAWVKALYARSLLRARDLLDMWPDGATVTRAGAVLRMCCPKFWRRVYRRLHARTVELCAIDLGLVHRGAELYASGEAVRRRRGQNLRNAAALESVEAVNDAGQSYTLADLAARGVGNKTIRRNELMTRLAGFELIGKDLGHVAYMVSVTCPSRMHKYTTAGGRPVPNKKYDGTKPDAAGRYLAGQWQKLRAAAARRGLGMYGFRIAEPQHDGTPHWHLILWLSGGMEAADVMKALFRRYFLENDSATERGAAEHRLDFTWIDPAKGSAVGYVSKYVAKNIDGYKVGSDLFGNDAIEASARVEAWAATWRVRQFQQFGGPPVTVWRELRRLHPDNVPEAAPEVLRSCVTAMNLQKTEPGLQAAAWRRYVNIQGGPCARRKAHSVKLLKQERADKRGRYGEQSADAVIGIEAQGFQLYKSHLAALVRDAAPIKRPFSMSVESERAAWFIVSRAALADRAGDVREFIAKREALRARTGVNNCTDHLDPQGARVVDSYQTFRGQVVPRVVSGFAPVRQYRPKLRRWVNWGRGAGVSGVSNHVES